MVVADERCGELDLVLAMSRLSHRQNATLLTAPEQHLSNEPTISQRLGSVWPFHRMGFSTTVEPDLIATKHLAFSSNSIRNQNDSDLINETTAIMGMRMRRQLLYTIKWV